MEFIPDGDLSKLIQSHKTSLRYFQEDFIWSVFGQILLGISDLHRSGVIHRDIKPANIFVNLTSQTVKIGDLNISKVLKQK